MKRNSKADEMKIREGKQKIDEREEEVKNEVGYGIRKEKQEQWNRRRKHLSR